VNLDQARRKIESLKRGLRKNAHSGGVSVHYLTANQKWAVLWGSAKKPVHKHAILKKFDTKREAEAYAEWLGVKSSMPFEQYEHERGQFEGSRGKRRKNAIDPFATMAAATSFAWNLAMSREVKRLREKIEGKKANPRGGSRAGAGRRGYSFLGPGKGYHEARKLRRRGLDPLSEAMTDPDEPIPTPDEMRETETFFEALRESGVADPAGSVASRMATARDYDKIISQIKDRRTRERMAKFAIGLLQDIPFEHYVKAKYDPVGGPILTYRGTGGGRRVMRKPPKDYLDNQTPELDEQRRLSRRTAAKYLRLSRGTPRARAALAQIRRLKKELASLQKRANPTLLIAHNPSEPCGEREANRLRVLRTRWKNAHEKQRKLDLDALLEKEKWKREQIEAESERQRQIMLKLGPEHSEIIMRCGDEFSYGPQPRDNPRPSGKRISPRLMRDPRFRAALAKYRQFFGDDPVEIVEVKDAPKGFDKKYKYLVGLGKAPEVTYAPHKDTPKGKGPPFMHEWEHKPYLALSADEKYLGYVGRGKGYKVKREGIHG